MSDISLSNTNIPSVSLGLPSQSPDTIKLNSNTNTTVSLPSKEATKTTKTKTGSKGSVEDTVNKISSTANKLAGEFSKFTSKVSQLTSGVINMLPAQYRSNAADALKVLNTGTDVLETLSAGQNGSHVQISSANPQPEAFKWVEQESIPADFVSYDSVLIFAGEPIYKDNPIGSTFIPLGFCQNFNISGSNNVLTVQELRCEEQIVLPGKTMPVNINIARLCGDWRNLLSRLHITDTENANKLPKWTYSMQYKGMRNLFGLLVMVMDTSRREIISQFYIERCAVQSWSWGMSAGSMQILDNVNIIAGRIIDPAYQVVIEAELKKAEEAQKQKEEAQKELEAEGKVVQYDDEGNPIATVDENGRTTMHYTDINGKPVEGEVIMYADGTMRTPDGTQLVTDANGMTIAFTEADSEKASKALRANEKANDKYSEAMEGLEFEQQRVKNNKGWKDAFNKAADQAEEAALEARKAGNNEEATRLANEALEARKNAKEWAEKEEKAHIALAKQQEKVASAKQKADAAYANAKQAVSNAATQRLIKADKDAQKAINELNKKKLSG